MENHNRRLVHERARENVAASRDASTSVGFPRLVTSWREAEMRPYRSRSRKAAGILNCADVNQGRERADARHCHQKMAGWIRFDLSAHCFVEHGDLLTQLSPSSKQRPHDQTKVGRIL